MEKSEYRAKIEAMGLKKNSSELRTHLKIAQIFSDFKDKVEILENLLPSTIYKLTQKRYAPVIRLLLCSKTAPSQIDVENMMSRVRGDKKATSRGWITDNKGDSYIKTETPRIYDEQAGEAILQLEKTGLNRPEILTAAVKLVYDLYLETGKFPQDMKGEIQGEQSEAQNHLKEQDNTEERSQTWKEFQIETSRNRLIRDNYIPDIDSNTYQSVTELACQVKEYSQLIETIENQEYNSNEAETFFAAIDGIKNEQNDCINEVKTIAANAGCEIIEDKLIFNNELVWKCAPQIDVIAQEQMLAINPIKYRDIFQPEEIIKKAISQEISWDNLKKSLYRIYELTQNNPHHYLESVLSQLDAQSRKNVREVFPQSLSKLKHSLTKGQIFDYVYLLPQNLVLIRYSEEEQEIVPECLVEKRLSNIAIRSTVSI
ncbi:MAG: hypothetical protein HC836_19230 [Richelia sp. RM2_1_2]|nr:hypothetical protein [Richelia sp. RM2_1_2]